MTLRKSIEDELLRIEIAEDYKLSAQSAEFIINTTTEFISRNLYKFINGAREHGDDFLASVDHVDEAYKEVLDILNYINAIRFNKLIHDRRYTIETHK